MKFFFFLSLLLIGLQGANCEDLTEVSTYSFRYAKPKSATYDFESIENGHLSVSVAMELEIIKDFPSIKVTIGRKKFCIDNALEESEVELFKILDSIVVEDIGVGRSSIVISFQTLDEYNKVSAGIKKSDLIKIPILRRKIDSHRISVKLWSEENFRRINIESNLRC